MVGLIAKLFALNRVEDARKCAEDAKYRDNKLSDEFLDFSKWKKRPFLFDWTKKQGRQAEGERVFFRGNVKVKHSTTLQL